MSQRRKRTRTIGGKSAARAGMNTWAAPLLAALASAAPAWAGMTPVSDYDFQWAVIGDPGNAAYDGRFNDQFATGLMTQTIGRGGVDYTYRISTLEVTTQQWLEFYNTFATQSQEFDDLLRPIGWAARQDDSFSGPGVRFELSLAFPDPANIAVTGMSWRQAAMFANWLHNGKSSDPASLRTGAYDTSTFGFDETTRKFTDDTSTLPGARFWIPSLDEWMKAAHYDPNRFAPGEGGWWRFGHSSDEPPAPGLPGEEGAQTSAGADFGFTERPIVGAFPDARSPWGLLDVSGGAREWTSSWFEDEVGNNLVLEGVQAGGGISFINPDDVSFVFQADPAARIGGLRIASAVSRSPDLDADGAVGSADLSALLEAWGDAAASPADLTLDGVVDGADLGVLLGAWGSTPPSPSRSPAPMREPGGSEP